MWDLLVFTVTVLLYSVSSQNNNSCRCVPYFQCRQDGKIITDGEGLFDERAGGVCTTCNCTNDLEICCSLANEVESNLRSPASQILGTCGYSNPDGVGFKVSAESDNTQFGEFPWMIKIFEDGSYRCGGSLIHPSVVLTAAHCLKSINSTFTVRGGEWDSSNTDEILKHQDRNITSFKIHDKFHKQTYINDVALVFLDQPFELKAHINTTCLAPEDIVLDGKRCVATGWGNSLYGSKQNGSSILRKVDLPMINNSNCEKSLRNTRLGSYFRLHDSFICAGGEKSKDTCTGDGGGPLFCPIQAEDDRYVQVGIIAWGIDCNNENVPGVYANVAFVRKWIDKQMKERKLDTQSYTFE